MAESARNESKFRLRIENLSDLVFGLALSIGSIILISNLPQTPSDLVSAITQFGASFLIVVWIWSGYSRATDSLPFEVAGGFLLNIILLFCVAIEPYLFYVLDKGQPSLQDFASSVYGVDVGAMMFLLAGMAYVALREEKKGGGVRRSVERVKRFRRTMMLEAIVGTIFFASAIPIFWISAPVGGSVRVDIWYVTLALFFAVSRPLRIRQ
ncbi:MAG: hypothetical protein OK456_05935 [Thaumarchaeota archaeon]|nr:hypothetical protein [Nitrososphaerota archaeon]